MKPVRNHPPLLLWLALFIAAASLPLTIVLAQSGGGYHLEWNTYDAGGHTFSSGGGYTLGGTVGQPDAGALSGGAYTLNGGFWNGLASPQAITRYAAPTAQGSGDCSDWADACTLQTALAQAVSGDEIWVKMGVHYPGAAGNRTATFTLKNGVAVYGGFAGTETSRDGRNWPANPTILSGDIDGNDNHGGDYINENASQIVGNNAYHVVTGGGTDSTAVLDGFIITAGQTNFHPPYNSGGGMYNSSSNPTLRNLIFSGNSASFGGGMYNGSSNPTLTNVTFSGNSAQSGGGMYNGSSSPTLTNVTFSGNHASSFGGGMRNYDGSSPTLTNATFSGNSASYGGGMDNYWYSSPTLTNVILWGDNAPNGPEIYNGGSSAPVVTYSDIQGGYAGTGNINADPLFVDAAGGNLRLQLTSPAIDAGNNVTVPAAVTTDLDGNPRFVDVPIVPDTGNGTPPIVDMGAYEAQVVEVSLSKAIAPTTAAPGQAITFTLLLSNSSESSIPAADVVVTDTLPAILSGLSFTSTLAVTDTGHIPAYVWMVQDLAAGQGGVITVSGALTVPLAAGVYTNTAVITATGDLLAENNTAVVTFTVPNVAPVFTSAPVVTATQDVPYIYTAVAADDNGDALTIIAPTLPAWLTLTDHGNGTATLSGTPSNADVGDHPVPLRVSDSGGLTATQSFTVSVANVNDAPLFTSAPVTTATQGVLYTYAVAATDLDLPYGDVLTVTAPALPAWLTLQDHDDGTATLSGTPTDADVGDHLVVLQVIDSGGLTDTQSFTVTVANDATATPTPTATATPTPTATATPTETVTPEPTPTATPAPFTGLVTGVVYIDDNGDGAYAPGIDTPLSGVTVVITSTQPSGHSNISVPPPADATATHANGGDSVYTVVYTVVTDSNGHYEQLVPAGEAIVQVLESSLPAGLGVTLHNVNPSTVLVPVDGSVTVNDIGFAYIRLGLAKIVTSGQASSFSRGDDIHFTIVFTNASVIDVRDVIVTEYIPDGLSYSPHDDNGWTLSPDGRIATLTLNGPVAPNAVQSVAIVLRVDTDQGATVVNQVSVNSLRNGSGAVLPDPGIGAQTPVNLGAPTSLTPEEEPTLNHFIYLPAVANVSPSDTLGVEEAPTLNHIVHLPTVANE